MLTQVILNRFEVIDINLGAAVGEELWAMRFTNFEKPDKVYSN
jgi:hypothetical protein